MNDCNFRLHARGDLVMDVIPVDMVVSTILAAGAKAEKRPEEVRVFHCISGTAKPTKWGKYCDSVVKASRVHPCESMAWYPRCTLRESSFSNNLVTLVFQILPAYIIDLLFLPFTNPAHRYFYIFQSLHMKLNKYVIYTR